MKIIKRFVTHKPRPTSIPMMDIDDEGEVYILNCIPDFKMDPGVKTCVKEDDLFWCRGIGFDEDN